MKIQLTSKETRKLNSAISLVDQTLARFPVPKAMIKSTASISHKFNINADGSSELEIHEKSFSTFLDSGSEAVIKLGQLVKSTFAEFTGIAKEFNYDMEAADTSIQKRGEAFATAPEYKDTYNPASTPFCPSQEEYLKELLGKEGFAEILKSQKALKPRIKVLPSNSESIPYEVRLQAAKQTVSEAILDATTAASYFGVKEEDIVKGFQLK